MKELKIKEVAKSNGFTLDELSKQMGITYTSFFRRIDNPKISTLEEIARILNCSIQELLPAPDGYEHFYNAKGEWLYFGKKHLYKDHQEG